MDPLRPSAIATARALRQGLDRIEEVPEPNRRQAQVLDLLAESAQQCGDADVRRMLELTHKAVGSKDRVYAALRVGRLAESAVLDGLYGSAAGLSQYALRILDTVQFDARDRAARVLVEGVREAFPADSAPARVLQMTEEFAGTSHLSTAAVVEKGLRLAPTVTSLSPVEMFEASIGLVWDRVEGGRFWPGVLEPGVRAVSDALEPEQRAGFAFAWKVAQDLEDADVVVPFLRGVVQSGRYPSTDAEKLALASQALGLEGRATPGEPYSLALLKDVAGEVADPRRAKLLERALRLHEMSGEEQPELVRAALELAARPKPGKAETLEMLRRGAAGVVRSLQHDVEPADVVALCREATRLPILGAVREMEFGSGMVLQAALDGASDERELLAAAPEMETVKAARGLLTVRAKAEPERSALALGVAALGHGSTVDAGVALQMVDRVLDGPAGEDPLRVAGDLLGLVQDPVGRNSVMGYLVEELKTHLASPAANGFMDLCVGMARRNTQYSDAAPLFAGILARAAEVRERGSFHPVDDPLAVINELPDRLSRATLLRGLAELYADRMERAGRIPAAANLLLHDASCFGRTTSERLAMVVDGVNVLASAEKSPRGAWSVALELLRRADPSLRASIAVSAFAQDSVPWDDDANAALRQTAATPEDWSVLDSLASGDASPSGLRVGLEKLLALRDPEARGAAALMLLSRLEGDLASLPASGRKLDARAGETALVDAVRRHLDSLVGDEAYRRMLVGRLAVAWQPSNPAANARLLVGVLSEIPDAGVPAPPGSQEPGIRGEDAYVVIGGVVLPRR